MSGGHPDKTCVRCGRRFSWRKKWERDWEEVRYCSTSCRRRKVGVADRAREDRILRALQSAPTAQMPLSALADDSDEGDCLRQAARRLALEGRIIMSQKGRPVEPRDIRGPVDVSLPTDRCLKRLRMRG